MREAASPGLTAQGSDALTKVRYLVSVMVGGLVLGFALSTQLNAIVAGLALPVAMVAAIGLGLPIALFMRSKGWRKLHHAIAAGVLLGLFPWGVLAGFASLQEMLWDVVVGAGVAVTAWLTLKLQTLPLRRLPPRALAPATGALALVVLGLGIAGTYGARILIYGPPASPESMHTVAAFEVPLPSEQERSQFLDLLGREAAAEGLHVDSADAEELRHTGEAIPEATATIDAAVWRGAKDNRFEVGASDRFHPGIVWITFARGEDAELAERFRERAMRRIMERWPGTRALPVTPTGAIPLHNDMVLTPDGYRVKASAASRYKLSTNSPLVAQDAAAGVSEPGQEPR